MCVYQGGNNNLRLLGAEERAAVQWSAGEIIALPICMSIVGAFVLGVALVAAFRVVPSFMVYSVVVIKTITPAVVGVLIYSYGHATVDVDDSSGSFSMYPTYVLFGISAVIGLVFFCYRDALRLCVQLFKESSVGIQDNWTLIPMQSLVVFVAATVKVMMFVGASWYVMHFAVVEPVIKSNDAQCLTVFSSGAKAMIPFSLFMMSWWMFVGLEVRTMIIGDSIGCWYWHGNANKGNNVARAAKNTVFKHFGTCAFAALVTWVIEWLKKKAKKSTVSVNPVMCLINCCIKYLILVRHFSDPAPARPSAPTPAPTPTHTPPSFRCWKSPFLACSA